MHKMAFRGGNIVVIAEQSDAVTHTAVPQILHDQPCVYEVRKSDRRKVVAFGFHYKADGVASFDVEYALLDQILIHRGIEKRVVNDIVYMMVNIVVDPARGDRLKVPVLIA